MRKEWDTIVVGAGVGGLTAAAKLVKAGQRVLVLDRNPHPGGTAYVYRRKGFAFPMGPLGFSHPELIKSILAIWVKMIPSISSGSIIESKPSVSMSLFRCPLRRW